MTDKADTVRESPTDQESAEDLQAHLPADQVAEADQTTDAQEDTEAPHHITSTFLPLQDPMQNQKAKADIQHLFQQTFSHFQPTVIQKNTSDTALEISIVIHS